MPVETDKRGFIPASSMNLALCAKTGFHGTLWFHAEDSLDRFLNTRKIRQLPSIRFRKRLDISCTNDINAAVSGKNVIFVTPRSWDLRSTLIQAKQSPDLDPNAIWICGTKGFDESEGKFYTPSQVIEEIIPGSRNKIAIVSGPNFSDQMIKGAVTTTVVAAYERETALRVKKLFNNNDKHDFIVNIYRGDPRDVEVVAAFKNVVGLVMGFARTLKGRYRSNTGAAILHRGVLEAGLLCKAMGRNPDVLLQSCVIGDYGLLMNSMKSRNVRAGYNFGKGEWDLNYLKDPDHTIEGVRTVKAAATLAGKYISRMPLTAYAYLVLYEGMNPQRAAMDLLEGKAPPISPIA